MSGEAQAAWWKEPLRVIQPNLQVRDTACLDPERLADQMAEMGANVVVLNVGGIYAWYPTRVANHTVNEYLPADFDLLEETIRAMHRRNIRFVARFDFSKAEDSIYLRHPQWFVRDIHGEPEVIGARRPGQWSLLMSTCINGDYRADAVAIPILREVLSRYEVDGVFFNNPGYLPCFCDGCRRKYRETYGEDLPDSVARFRPDWASRCMRDNIHKLRECIRRERPDIPLILYYGLYRDNIHDRAATADLLCIEPQDVLSLGHRNIPDFWKPALSIKLGRTLEDTPSPFGIVHSCPGMDWRHTGLPVAEYRFWLSQITANGGHIWHSLTGMPDTIRDKRILEVVSEQNAKIKRVEPYMAGAESGSETVLIWNGEKSAEGWTEGLLERQVPFDLLLPEQAEAGRLDGYKVAIVPEGTQWTRALVDALGRFAEAGGGVIVEGTDFADALAAAGSFPDWLGIAPETFVGEELAASYIRFEGTDNPLQRGMEQTELIPHRGKVAYCRPAADAEVLATLVPPFSPLESVGAPPERASLPVERTDIPLILRRAFGRGKVLLLPFSFGALLKEYRLNEHYLLLRNMVQWMAGGRLNVDVSHAPGLQVTVFRRDDGWLIHLVNGAGTRPLTANLPIHDVTVKVGGGPLPFTRAQAVISGAELQTARQEDHLEIRVPVIREWEAVWVQ